ncbi:hypothetical protein WMY93_016228 [Mugilogobius chulae]|uniref:Reverse transcriptase n=1 Tax=Mugilogobius chulae TaxID=88201 RepID=A0AAW0NX92_9GOBI
MQEQRWRTMQGQVQNIQQQVLRMQSERSEHQNEEPPALEPETVDEEDNGGFWNYRPQPKLLPLTQEDDIEHFLITFERMARVSRWPEEEWAVRLVPLLTGKARNAYVLMDFADTEDYKKIKSAILAKYEITAETYRRRFRSLEIEPDETPRELYVRLKELFYRWVQPEKSNIRSISETLILEQFLRMVSPELEVFIREHNATTAEEAARLADVFTAARKGTRSTRFGREPPQVQPSKSFGVDRRFGPSQSSGRPSTVYQQSRPLKKPFSKTPAREVRCYNCNGLGHTQHFCPALKTKPSLLCSVPRPPAIQSGEQKGRLTPVLVNGHRQEALLDSGCFQTVVLSTLVPPERQSLDKTPLVCIHGDEHLYPTAEVFLTVGGQTYLVTVALSKNLPYAVILGNDIPTLPDLIAQSDCSLDVKVSEREIIDKPSPELNLANPCNVLTRAQSARGVMEELPFYDEELEAQPGKTRKVGVSKEILTDCGTNFLSKLLQQVYQLLGVKGIKTTPYHPQTDGLVERYNQTLKSMLRKFVSTTGADWDQWLPYLLFAYREVPQASTGFSPFELLYGRQVRGPLDLLKDHWEHAESEKDNIVAYVLKMRERLEAMASLAQENLKAAQERQKTWYDRKAKDRVFTPGQKVLLLLPTSENKLLAKWHGPYEITRQLGKVNYELHMPERLKKYQVFHVNLLKEFLTRQEPSQQLLVCAVKDEEVTDSFFPTLATEPAAVDLSHLSPLQQGEINHLLDPNLFQETPGFTSLVQHKIRLKKDVPVRQRSYRIPERLVAVLQKEIKLMLELGIIEVSSSEWCSPVVLVPKKDGSLRFCIDFRYLNAISNFDPYPMPRIDDLLERVGGASYITTLDLSRGYWQLALAPEARELTAFRTPFGLYQFRVMPFGLQGAPATFQRLMDFVLKDVAEFSAAYLDDVVVFSKSWEEHLYHLEKVLQKIRAAGLTINPRKCAVAHQEVEYLGYTIGYGRIKPQVQKIEAIRSFPVPTTKRKVRGFIGLVGWYRKFVPQFAERTAVLNNLTKNSAPNKVIWSAECDQAFEDLKEAICTGPVLHSPDFEKPFILQTDASGVGLGAVLLQEKEGERRPVVFLSRKLLDRETRYSTVEKECLAMKWAIDSLRYYLLGRHFTLETDHRALQWLHRMRDANTRIAGWYLALQPYNFTVQYRPGKTNVVADCLSRMTED